MPTPVLTLTKAPRIFQIHPLRSRSLFYRMSLSQSRFTLLRDML